MNLAIDIGNSRVKAGLFDGDSLVDIRVFRDSELTLIAEQFSGQCENVIVCSTSVRLEPKLLGSFSGVKIILDHNTRIPIVNNYITPESLGMDRLAAAVGGYMQTSSASAALVVDLGSCMTLDVVTAEGEYLGGNISPGVQMRFRAMHQFTKRLPMGAIGEASSFIGRSTSEALANGVFHGVRLEVEGYISRLEAEYGKVKTILTGGDASYFAGSVKTGIFVRPDLVLEGLNEILKLNVED